MTGTTTMVRQLDLADIQGNIVRPYGRFGFPSTRHLFFNIGNAAAGRYFIEQVRHIVTTAERWASIDAEPDSNAPQRPLVAVNIGLSFLGLAALELPTRTLRLLPDEFIDGMVKRGSILGDFGPSHWKYWDPIWTDGQSVPGRQIHLWISLNAQAKPDGTPVDELAEQTSWLEAVAAASNGVTLLDGHRGPNTKYQDSTALMDEIAPGIKVPTPREHFGFTDGISDPVFAGQYGPEEEKIEAIGGGKFLAGDKNWQPLATGEFILGHANEAQELPPTAPPWSFMRNGTFMAYRKLHQNVASFNDYIKDLMPLYKNVTGETSDEAACETIRAKMVGRWRLGIPLAAAPTFAKYKELLAQYADIPAIEQKGKDASPGEKAKLAAFERLLVDFRYADDIDGATCPVSAHTRRVNPRDALDPLLGAPPPSPAPGSTLSNRRRILRRGLPYGDATPPNDANEVEHGVVFMAICASLFNQFEFIQQQWMNYGASFNVGNDTDTIVGIRRPGAKYVIPAGPATNGKPFICANLPLFVQTRGGEYFFLPSLTALREIAEGSVDPT